MKIETGDQVIVHDGYRIGADSAGRDRFAYMGIVRAVFGSYVEVEFKEYPRNVDFHLRELKA